MDALNIRPDGIYVDGTAGGGGHSAGIASRLTTGRLIAIDQDEAAVRAASEYVFTTSYAVRSPRPSIRISNGASAM